MCCLADILRLGLTTVLLDEEAKSIQNNNYA